MSFFEEYYNEVFYLEGKKEIIDRLNIFKYGEPIVREKGSYPSSGEQTFDILRMYDPTKTGKYMILLTSILIDECKKRDSKKPWDILSYYLNDEFTRIQFLIKAAEEKGMKIDVSKIKDKETFISILKEHLNKITKSTKRKGISGLKENQHYITVPISNKQLKGYIPLSFDASKILASSRDSKCDGAWCVAYQKNPHFWEKNVENNNILVYLTDWDATDLHDHRIALQFKSPDKFIIWDAEDHTNDIKDIDTDELGEDDDPKDKIRKTFNKEKLVIPNIEEIKSFVKKNWNTLLKKIK